MQESFFVTSSGTEIGKTVVSTLLVQSLSADYESLGYWKPVASGCESGSYGYRSPDEVEVIKNTSLNSDDVHASCRFDAPLSPDKAAARESRQIHPDEVLTEWGHLQNQYDALVVEGIGGVAVPFTQDYDVTNLAADLSIPTLLVVSTKLGTISYTRTARSYLEDHDVPCNGILLTPAIGESIESTNRNHLRSFFPDHFVELLPDIDREDDSAESLIDQYRVMTES